ncbi:MAG: formylglycine-generating enzyme family protein [Acidimicrobiales bacterium]|nr:formylglycine-generating enzyme family protein [Acidimicrobiales bacterium]
MTTPDPDKQSIIKAPSRAVAKARSNMASRALASVQVKTNSIGMKLKLIPAGEFLMGSPESEPKRRDREVQHRVRITKPFYMQTTTVTQSQWMSVMGTEPWEADEEFVKQGSDYPATYVSHDDAVDFCRKLSARENATYRLPTEAEWEYACRARSSAAYSFGDNAEQLEQYAWFHENAGDVDEEYAHRVGQKLPNSFGLYDMHGNVLEWCSDWFEENVSGEATDPTGSSSGSYRVIRGGSWNFTAELCRSAFRSGRDPSFRYFNLGFRVSLSPSGQ